MSGQALDDAGADSEIFDWRSRKGKSELLMRVLLVADGENYQLAGLVAALNRAGAITFRVSPNRLTWAATDDSDILILDSGVPYDQSIAICREVRGKSDIPIMMISDRPDRVDRIRGLRAGADDYLARPVHFDELITRIAATTRPRGSSRSRESSPVKKVRLDDLEIDFERLTVTVAGTAVGLTKKEFQMLALIVAADGSVCAREKIAAEVWGRPEEEVSDSIQVLISRLRTKIGRERIKTVRSVGYHFVARSKEA